MKVAAVQLDIRIGDVAGNLQRICRWIELASAQGATLVVFPESALAGYCFDSLAEALPFSQQARGAGFAPILEACRLHNVVVVLGYLEREGDRLFNSAACLGPQGWIGNYRKVHLPFLGIDRFTTAGDRLDVFDAGPCRLGLSICYDSSFPEAMRVLMLQGADVMALPTNWPPTSGRTADLIPPARALENNVYVIAANRIGEERGFRFIGKSRICDPRGGTLASADHEQEALLVADLDLALARQKHLVNIPGIHEVDRLRDRRPDCYSRIVEAGGTAD